MLAFGERDWSEDSSMENGKYLCNCRFCGLPFIGHKRRVQCRKCHRPHSPDAYALVEKVLRNREVLDVAFDILLIEESAEKYGFQGEADEYFTKIVLEHMNEQLQQLIDSL